MDAAQEPQPDVAAEVVLNRASQDSESAQSVTPAYGAMPEDWVRLDLCAGLTEDLLPVVSNPHATIARNSTLKAVGKVPSLLDAQRNVVGVRVWTRRRTCGTDIDRWSKDRDLGICIQTRRVRALDVDVDDPQIAAQIEQVINQFAVLPKRYRSNSGKFLVAFEMPGEFRKRRLKVEGGYIELLAEGQQFIAVGTHPSGVRYQWKGGLPSLFPKVGADEFDALWQELEKAFGIGRVAPTPSAQSRIETSVAPQVSRDELVEMLGFIDPDDLDYDVWLKVLMAVHAGSGGETWGLEAADAWSSRGMRYDAGEVSSRWRGFIVKLGGVTVRTLMKLARERGWDGPEPCSEEFQELNSPAEEPPPLFRRDRAGRIYADLQNVITALRRPDFIGMDIRFDEFRGKLMLAERGGEWQAFQDEDYVRLRILLEERGFKPVAHDRIRDVVHVLACDNRFDSAREWLYRFQWDQVPRVHHFLAHYFGAEDNDYSRAVSAYLWTALAGRVVTPGVKTDMVPILIGDQGVGKSTGVAAMCPDPECLVEISFQEKDDDLARRMRGCLIGEIGELSGLHTKELEWIKAFVTRTSEKWVPKYQEFARSYQRRIVFVGTTNQELILADETGNRRWLPVKVARVNLEAIRRDRLQLWAEGRVLYEQKGVANQDAERLAALVHRDHTIRDSWEDAVRRWLDDCTNIERTAPKERDYLRMSDVLSGALSMEPRSVSRLHENRMGKVLRNLGYQRCKVRDGEETFNAWFPPVPT